IPWIDVRGAQGLGFRLRVAAFVPMGLCAAAVVGHLAAYVPKEARTIVPVVFAAVWVAVQPPPRDAGIVRTHPALALGAAALATDLPPDAIVICPERHIVFMAAWYTGADVRLRPEGVPPDRAWRLLPLAFIGKDSALDRALMKARDQPGVTP